jgi:hypothetical protein
MHASHTQIQQRRRRPPPLTSSNHNHIEVPVIQAKPKYPSGATRFLQHFYFIENNDVSIAARSSTQVRSHVMRESVRTVAFDDSGNTCKSSPLDIAMTAVGRPIQRIKPENTSGYVKVASRLAFVCRETRGADIGKERSQKVELRSSRKSLPVQ